MAKLFPDSACIGGPMHKNNPAANNLIDRRAFLRNTTLLTLGAATGLYPHAGWTVENDILHIRSYNDLVSLDPATMLSGAEGLIGNSIYLSLVQFQPGDSWEWDLDAAEYFEQIDATHYAFRLRPGIRFSNGFGEMTAEDVKFSLERIIDPAMNSPNAGDMGTLSHVEITGRYSGTIVLKSPFAAFIPIGLCAGTGSIVSKKAVESVGDRYEIEPPCCSGPYRFVSWQAQRKTILERNPDWTGPEPAFREIHVYPLTDVKAAELAFEAGELDCTQVAIESVDLFRRKMPPQSRLDVFSSLRYYWIGLNRDHPKLQDIRVRQAVQYGIDVEAVIEAAWFGLATPATGIIAPGLIGHRERADIPLRGDREVARRLLREAGVKLPLKLKLSLPADALELTAGQVVQWSLGKIGIEVELDPQDNATLITLGMESAGDRWKDLEMHLQSFFMLGDPYYATEWFVAEQVGVWNWERFRSEEFDHLHETALALTDPAERDPLYQHMQHLMEASGCYRFLTHSVEAILTRLWLEPAFRADGYPMYPNFGIAHQVES
jgi:peptide/nickel transport system substrate-binding protein